MRMILSRSRFVLVPILAGLATVAFAALPASVDGEALPTLAPMLERVTPAVVNVHSKTRVRVANPFADDPYYRHFFGIPDLPQERMQQSLGSGVVVDAARGYVLTNNHVIDGADEISVTLADGRTLPAQKVGADAATDVAVIRVPPQNLTAVPLARSSALRVGDFVVAVGNPFGLGQTVTSGIVSALGRAGLSGVGVQNFIQTDAAINMGNSGGALVNLRGELIGINTLIFSPSGGSVGIGFAIPSDLAAGVMRQLVAGGQVRRGSLGIETQDVDETLAGIVGVNAGRGAVVTRVNQGSPAERAGVETGDAVVSINGSKVTGARDLANQEALLPVDSKLALGIVRRGRPLVLSAVLDADPRQRIDGGTLDPRVNGASFVDLPAEYAERGINGVQVSRVARGSRAAQNGLRANDVVLTVNGAAVADVAAFNRALRGRPAQLVLGIARGRRAGELRFE